MATSRLVRKTQSARKGQELWLKNKTTGSRTLQVDHLAVTGLPGDVLKAVARQCALAQALYSLAIIAREQAAALDDDSFHLDADSLEEMGKQYWAEHKKMLSREQS